MDKIHYFIDTGNDKDYGQVIFWDKEKKLKNVFDIFGTPKQKKDDSPSCSMREALSKQHLFVNSIIATYVGSLIWDILTKRELDMQGVVVNLNTMKTNSITIQWKRNFC